MQGVLIDDHRIHVDFSQSVCYSRIIAGSYSEHISRSLDSRTLGEMQQIRNVQDKAAASVAFQISRKNDNIER